MNSNNVLLFYSSTSKERLFFADAITCIVDTEYGKRWLSEDGRSEAVWLLCSIYDNLWTSIITDVNNFAV